MSVVTVIWSMSAAASLMLGAVYLFIWIGDRRQLGHLAFSTLAVGIAAFAGFELAMMHASSSAHYATLSRWIQVPTWVMIASIVWFTRAHLRAGRPWLGWTIVGLRTLALLVNFSGSGSITFREGAALEQVPFFGERVFIPVAEPKPWMLLPHASVLLLLLFLVDASISVWRRGERRLALIVGGSMVLFTLQGLLQVVLVLWGFIVVPMRISVGFLIMLLVMAFEISRQIRIGLHAARQLHEAEQQAQLTVGVARVGFWSWDVQRGDLWASSLARVHLGLSGREAPRLQDVLDAAHDDDRESVQRLPVQDRFGGLADHSRGGPRGVRSIRGVNGDSRKPRFQGRQRGTNTPAPSIGVAGRPPRGPAGTIWATPGFCRRARRLRPG